MRSDSSLKYFLRCGGLWMCACLCVFRFIPVCVIHGVVIPFILDVRFVDVQGVTQDFSAFLPAFLLRCFP